MFFLFAKGNLQVEKSFLKMFLKKILLAVTSKENLFLNNYF